MKIIKINTKKRLKKDISKYVEFINELGSLLPEDSSISPSEEFLYVEREIKSPIQSIIQILLTIIR